MEDTAESRPGRYGEEVQAKATEQDLACTSDIMDFGMIQFAFHS